MVGLLDVEWALIGSCTNSSYEDLTRAASTVEDAVSKGVKPKAILGINPGSEQVRFTAERDGLFDTFNKLNRQEYLLMLVVHVSVSGTGKELKSKRKNSIVHSFNRNFAKRRW